MRERTLGNEHAVHHARDHMAVLEVIVVVRPVDVCGDDAGKHAAVLLVVGMVRNVNHALGVGVAKVGVVRRAVVNHRLVDGVRSLVGEDARRQAAHHLGALQNS